ncbi:MAG: hypothetical protein JXQ71_06570 [Verrucomicrobia bacterium]|nr:hypothetical protein [Verrucomicrobiota bacterium]
MKRLIAGLSVVLAMTVAAAAASRSELWRQVEEALGKGLPRTAITNLNAIIPAAVRDQAWGEAAKAMARRMVLEGNIEGNKPEEKITRMDAEIAQAPAPVVPLLQTLRAHWYWHYFQQNRWRFLRRTATAETPGQDFTTWDLPRLFAEIDRQFQMALSNAPALKQTPVGQFDALLETGGLPDRYRPTLYDFIAHEALQFYTSGEQAAAKPQDAFELPATSPVFDPADKFLDWWRAFDRKSFPDSPIIHALDLYASLMTFHANDEDPTARLDADLARLVYGHNTAFGEAKAERYKAALKAFVDAWADHEVSAMALHYWARAVRDAGDWVAARTLAQRGKNAHPDSAGGKLCHNLIAELEAKALSISTERVWNCTAGGAARDPEVCPVITVEYRNLPRVHFRAVAWAWEDFLDRKHRRPQNLNDAEKGELLARPPELAWSADLPPTADYQQRVARLPAPMTLKPGHYFLVASHDPGFGDEDNLVSFTPFWVSDLALILRPRNGRLEGFVLDANSGEPLEGAEIMAWRLDRNYRRVAEPRQTTDANGFFEIKPAERRGYLVRARLKGREVASEHDFWIHPRRPPEARDQTIFFTDRALYRPGQAIQFKGIVARVDTEGDRYTLLGGRRVTVTFADPNGKEVAKAEHACNDYGSFSGSFTAPRDRVMGRYRLFVSSGEHGSAWINVEEYKRPKFRVTLDPPKTAARLHEPVVLEGKAEAYTGAAIDEAPVRWRVVREVRWPDWWGWWGWPRPGLQGSQEIAHGTARTKTDGTFKIEFVAKPDPQVSDKDEVSFHYAIHADVTDSAGETRSADRHVHVGFVALRASLSADAWQTAARPVELKLRTTTLDNEPQIAEGSVSIHRLKPPARVHRPRLAEERWRPGATRDRKADPDLSDPNHWDLGEVVAEKGFTTDAEGSAVLGFQLGAGVYRAMLETQDRFGKTITGRLPLHVLDPDAAKFAPPIPHFLAAPKWTLQPGDEFMALWGTGYDTGRAFVEVEHRHGMIQRFWTQAGRTQQQIKQAVTETMRGGFTLHITQVHANRAHLVSRQIEVPWSHKELELKWEHFVSKLQPGKPETWSLQLRAPQADAGKLEKTVAEMVATLYDASLDQFMALHWPRRLGFFYRGHSTASPRFANGLQSLAHLKGRWILPHVTVDLSHRHFPSDLVRNFWGYGYGWAGGAGPVATRRLTLPSIVNDMAGVETAMAPAAASASGIAMAEANEAYFGRALMAKAAAPGRDGADKQAGVGGGEAAPGAKAVDLSAVTARKNLHETAFFFPQLTSDSNGIVRMTFTMPEALTTWRFLGFAHDGSLRSGFLEGEAVTSKDIMVQPNPPRFLREGDTVEFTVKVSNQSAARQTGQVQLGFRNAATDESADALLKLAGAAPGGAVLAFDIPAKESRTLAWRISVPDGAPYLAYKAVGSTGRLSDGEEGYLPVLSRRVLVTESLPLPIRVKAGQGPVSKSFAFTKLLESGRSDTLVHRNLVVQMVSNPSWYAVLALPYLMEFPHECTEQTFNRLYANALARFIAQSNPKIRRIFDQWKNTPALDSPMVKNQDLKMVMIEETPWLREAHRESEARRNVGVLFDDNRLNFELEAALRKLRDAQLGDGAWPWFPGGRDNDYITLYITTGFGRLRHLGVESIDLAPALKSLARLDGWMNERHQRILKQPDPDAYVPSSTDALYLYGRSFFLKDRPVARNHQAAVEFFLRQSRKHWLQVANRQSQGHLALAHHRWGGDENRAAARAIMASIRERAVGSEELGMFWRDTEWSWWWFRAPIETQALMIEAFDEILGDRDAVEECRVWLLKQKQTRDWKTTKATADAVYALLLRGGDILASDLQVEVTAGGIPLTPGRADPHLRTPVEPGTGFYEHRFAGADIRPKLGAVTVRKLDEGVAWGSMHWQYLEDIAKVTPHEGTPLKLQKSLYTRMNTPRGPELRPVRGPVAVGDELVVRIVLRADRDMEYVHLKDHRGSGTEPVNVISRHRYQDGLAYYETTRDTASHFFIEYVPKGTYVFEYATRVQLRGDYQTGLAAIQCMYAPEFNSHSESLPLSVR